MRTRTSPRNQEILYRALGGTPAKPEPIMGPPEFLPKLSKPALAAQRRADQAAKIRAARKK